LDEGLEVVSNVVQHEVAKKNSGELKERRLPKMLRILVGLFTDLSVTSKIYFQCFGIILESQRCHGEQNVFAIDRFSFLLLALLGCYDGLASAELWRTYIKHAFAGDETDEL
jgi:hypothetical protein